MPTDAETLPERAEAPKPGDRVEFAGEEDLIAGRVSKVNMEYLEALVVWDGDERFIRWIDFDDLTIIAPVRLEQQEDQ